LTAADMPPPENVIKKETKRQDKQKNEKEKNRKSKERKR
jgi:hypothetical protein